MLENLPVKISNAICQSIKNFSDDLADALLSLQIIILALLKVKDGPVLKSEFDFSESTSASLGISYSIEALENVVNNEGIKEVIEIKRGPKPLPLVKCAVCIGTSITVYFNPEFNDLIIPKDSYSLFNIHDLLAFRTVGALSLYILLTASQNMAGVPSGNPFTYKKDFYPLCKQLGLIYSEESRPGCKLLDRFFKRTLPDLKMMHPSLKLSYEIKKKGKNPRATLRSTSIDIHVSGLKTEGIYGLSPTEIVDDGIPWFIQDTGRILTEMITKGDLILFENDELGRCTSATTLLTIDRIVATGGMKSTRVTPLGYDKVKKFKESDERFKIAKSHIIARRLMGPDKVSNMIVGTTLLNTEMARAESTIVRFIQANPEYAIVLYRVEPIYNGDSLIPQKIRLGAYNIDQGEKRLNINTEILNADRGLRFDSGTETVVKTE